MPLKIFTRLHLYRKYLTLIFHDKIKFTLLFAVEIKKIVVYGKTVGIQLLCHQILVCGSIVDIQTT